MRRIFWSMNLTNQQVFSLIFIIQFLISITTQGILGQDPRKYFNHIKPSASLETQRQAAQDVINRLLPNHAHLFVVEIDSNLPGNTFEIIKQPNATVAKIRGSTGVAACKGFYHYLKYYLKGHISWSGHQLRNIPDNLPSISKRYTSPNRFLYYQNVCTWSYSFAWWKWKEWRHHIDWMALMGINLSLAPIQEAIWTKIYRIIGLTEKEINEHFTGPGFFAWQRMGNIRGWGGPLSEKLKMQQLELQKQIIQAQRNLGMIVSLPGFAGHVPIAFQRIFLNATFTSATRWNRFSDRYCCPLFLDPSDPLFSHISEMFLTEIIREYGTDHIYFADPFNELEPRKADSQYLSETSLGIYDAMRIVDPRAIWLMQGWMFVKNPFWSDKLLKAFLTAVPKGKLLILDLESEQYPEYDRTKSYFGQPFIWNMLHNFGGTLGMHASLDIVNNRIEEAKNMPESSMIGIGITPEGINQNYPVYEFTLERAWSQQKMNLTEWFDHYSIVRYGIEDENLKYTWKLLLKSVYNYHGLIKIHGKYTICRRPSIKLSPWTWYNPEIVTTAWSSMLSSNYSSVQNDHLFQHDLVDLTRQFLQNSGDKIYLNIISEYKHKNLTALQFWSDKMIELLFDLENILKTHSNFLLGPWLESAKHLTDDWHEKSLYEYNARNQITTWGPNGEIIDYATKQWSGLIIDFFIPRWKLFLLELQDSLNRNKTFNEKSFKNKVFRDVENPFTMAKKIYPVNPEGSSIEVAKEIHSKWIQFWNLFDYSSQEILIKGENLISISMNVTPNVILN